MNKSGKKAYIFMIKYDLIGENYNETRKADPFIVSRIVNLLNLKNSDKIIDIGCGTGNYTIEIFKNDFDIIGLEPSEKMINEAKFKTNKIEWINGFAEKIPFKNESFKKALATLTIHHWNDLKKGFSEINRVLKTEGRFLIFTSTAEQMENYWLNNYFPEMMKKSIHQMPSFNNIIENLQQNNFEIETIENYNIKEDLQDKFLYIGKNNPEIYFDVTLRNGISSFASLSNFDEVENGLKKLKNDLNSGYFSEIKNNFNSENGDYIFIVAKKCF